MRATSENRIAIVDDYAPVAETIATYIRHMGYTPIVYSDPMEFLKAADTEIFDVVITDIRMPKMDGITLLKHIRKQAPQTQVILVSAHADKKDAIDALKLGAYDFFEKPVDREELVATINRTLGFSKVIRERDTLAQRLSLITEQEGERWGIGKFIGKSRSMADVFKKIRLLQKSQKTNVLILGESGTGKELVARSIHFGSKRADGPFVTVNCSAIPDELAESILFGHIKGAFTGATANQRGNFEMADGGTLFLDEIGDMPSMVQTKLLRVLEDGIVCPVGKSSGTKVDVRVISATNADIKRNIESSNFRLDLYHRLATYEIDLPPLRDRIQDLPLLVDHFLNVLSKEMGIARPHATDEFTDHLKRYSFPGNIRELKNIIERALINAAGDDLCAEHIQLPNHPKPGVNDPAQTIDSGPDEPLSIPLNFKAAEKLLVQKAINNAEGNIAKAARQLGINRSRIYRIIG